MCNGIPHLLLVLHQKRLLSRGPLLVLLTNNRSVNHKSVGIRLHFYYLRIREQYPIYRPQFYTATILEWKPLLKPDKYKEIIIGSLQYLTADKQITLYAFVIMSNHIHMIWQAQPGKTPEQVQHSFMKYTAQQIKFDLVANHPQVLDKFRVNSSDRTYQFWKRNSLGIELRIVSGWH